MIERSKIVTNGCNGNCCEKFTLAFSIEDLNLMILARDRGDLYYDDVLGRSRKVYHTKDIEKIVEMLIPLGETNINPQSELPILSDNPLIRKEEGWYYAKNKVNGKEVGMSESEFDERYFWKDNIEFGTLMTRIYTCKYFDTINKICTNYDNRPDMCKSFGETCDYKGCKYVALNKIEADKVEFKALTEKS